MAQVILTAYGVQPSQRGNKLLTSPPQVIYLQPAEIVAVQPKKNAAGVIIGSSIVYGFSRKPRAKFLVAERPAEVEVARDPSTSNVYAQSKNLAVTAAGTTAAAATVLAKYLNVVTAATTGSAEGVRLPSATAAQKATVVINSSTAQVQVFPATGEIINSLAANASVTLATGLRMHFYSNSTKWFSAAAE